MIAAGVLLQVLRSLIFARRTPDSATATAPLFVRWLLHHVGARPDPIGAEIFARLRSTSLIGCWMIRQPLVWAARVSGHPPRVFSFPPQAPLDLLTLIQGRTAFFDRVIEDHAERCNQLVILGAGFDTRAYTHGDHLRVFEVDAPATQNRKTSLLGQLNASLPQTAFVEVDFRQRSWLDALQDHGFDPNLPTIVLWEGVTYYLPETTIHEVLSACGTLPSGSVVAFDYFSHDLVHGKRLSGRLLTGLLVFLGEPWLFGLSTAFPASVQAENLLHTCGLSLREHQVFGREDADHLPFGGLVLGSV